MKPRWTSTRTARRLDGVWAFAFDPDSAGIADCWWAGPLPAARPMPVPASFNDLVLAAGEREYVGDVWYQTTVALPAATTALPRRTVLRFDAATHHAEVWVGDTRVGDHHGGYTPFEFDVSGLVDSAETLRITVRVDNRLTMHTIPPGIVDVDDTGRRRQRYFHDFFNYAGLPRSVWLVTTPTRYIADVTVRTDLEAGAGAVHYAVTLGGAAPTGPGVTTVGLRDAAGNAVAQATGNSGSLDVVGPRAWSPLDPHLYTLDIRHEDGERADVYELPVGIRTVRVDGTRLLLNGEPVHLRGFGMHEDAPWRGKGHDDARMVRDFALMRWVGANSFRTSHYPYAEEVLDLADRLGFLVIDETPAVGLNLALNAHRVSVDDPRTFRPGAVDDVTLRAHTAALREMIERDKNHPCVIAWSVANEPDTREAASRPYFAELARTARELDATRPVGFANVALATPELDQVTDLFDVVLLNRYFGWYVDAGNLDVAKRRLEAELREWAARYAKPIVVTEFGADAVAGLHALPAQMWTEEFQRELVATYLDVFAGIDEVVGEHVWNFADFATMQGVNRVAGNRKGVFTRDREPKAVAFLLRDRWAAKERPGD